MNNAEPLAGHLPASKVGGRRVSQNSGVPPMSKERESLNKNKNSSSEEGDEDHQMIRQEEMLQFEQAQRQQQHELKNNQKYTNAELNRAPNPVKNNHIRQPGRFPAGLPKETKMVMKELGK
ncbi:hypothetical protein GGI15_003773 [Coemansia interrupta]|uniref:Uncharacterized protein n=1 Tax=Coemansia interrupta TaxID=1126814 RepID=A0A9W8HCK6_9FUNG|nr:hypothetical protein GGI15_003773 [Coemansia interrupta]